MKKIIVATLFITGVFIFSGCGSKVPQSFIDKHNETIALEKEAQQLSDLTSTSEMETLTKQLGCLLYTSEAETV